MTGEKAISPMRHKRFYLMLAILSIILIYIILSSGELDIGMPQVIQIPQATVQAYRSSAPFKSREQVIIAALAKLETDYSLTQGSKLKIISAQKTNAWRASGYITNTGDGSDLQKSTLQKLKRTEVWFLILASDWRMIDPVRETYTQDSYFCVAVIGEVESGSVSVFPAWTKGLSQWAYSCKIIPPTASFNNASYPPPSPTYTALPVRAYPAYP